MAKEVLALRDFPPFVRFELEESFRRKIFAAFANQVGEAELGLHPETFWRSVEEEFDRSRHELIFGSLSGKILKTLELGPLEAKELLEKNPELSPYSIYHALVKLKKKKKLIDKKDGRWELKKGQFDHLRVSDLAKIIDLRQKGCRRKNALSITDVQMATYLWPEYERAADRAGIPSRSASYGKYYEDHFALARAVKEWARGDTNIPQWALVAIADLANVDIEGREVIVNYALPPGVKITPYYKGRYKLPIEISADFDLIALQILMKSSASGLVHPVKRKKELFKRLYHTFGSFQSDRIPLSIREIIAYYYYIPCCGKSSVRIPDRMKERWEQLSDHEQIITKILVLELLFNLDYRKRTYELISRSKDFLEDVSGIIRDLGAGDMTIRKRKDRPHYRSYLPKKVVIKLKELKENVEIFKIEKGIEFLDEKERKELIGEVKKYWDENGVNIISSLAMDKGVRDLDLARASGVTPQEVRRLLYELEDRAIITHLREETPELVEYYYYLNPEGIKRFLGEHKKGETEEQEKIKYPFPEELAFHQRRRLYSGIG
jgi:transcription initiation factor IIE alpha subunit